MYVCMYVCMCMYVYIYIYIYMYIHMYMYMNTGSPVITELPYNLRTSLFTHYTTACCAIFHDLALWRAMFLHGAL